MKEYPIIFSGPMVRAILEGRKTVTRRIDVDRWMKRRKGDRLWVKETFAVFNVDWSAVGIGYRADHHYAGDLTKTDGGYSFIYLDKSEDIEAARRIVDSEHWRPAIFMFRWASRVLLELIEDPRAERLQDITEEDAKAEGVAPWLEADLQSDGELREGLSFAYRAGFMDLWNSINQKRGYGWATNPRVARVAFRMLERERAA